VTGARKTVWQSAIGNRQSAMIKHLLSPNQGGNMPHHIEEIRGFFLTFIIHSLAGGST